MFENVKEVLVDALKVDPDAVTMEAELIKDLNVNSLDLADFVYSCEEKFNIEISDEDLGGFATVGDIVRYLEGKVN